MANLSESVDYLPSPELNNLYIHSGTGVWLETGFTLFVWTCTALSVSILFWIAGIVIHDAWPAIAKFGLGFVWGQTWSPLEQEFGALPYIYDTLVTCGLAIVLALILGLTVAIFTSEAILPRFVRWIISFTVELFVALPSVILLLWAVNVLAPLMYPLQEWLHRVLGWLPLFSPEPFGPSRLLAAIVLAIAILPTIAAISREVLLAIPKDLRSASMALGATRWETLWRVLLPAASPGIFGGTALALGRALGEAVAVVGVIGSVNIITPSLLDPGHSIPTLLISQFLEASDPLHLGALMFLTLVLFGITLVVNFLAVLLVELTVAKSA